MEGQGDGWDDLCPLSVKAVTCLLSLAPWSPPQVSPTLPSDSGPASLDSWHCRRDPWGTDEKEAAIQPESSPPALFWGVFVAQRHCPDLLFDLV